MKTIAPRVGPDQKAEPAAAARPAPPVEHRHYNLSYRLDGADRLFRARICAPSGDDAVGRLAGHVGVARMRPLQVVLDRSRPPRLLPRAAVDGASPKRGGKSRR